MSLEEKRQHVCVRESRGHVVRVFLGWQFFRYMVRGRTSSHHCRMCQAVVRLQWWCSARHEMGGDWALRVIWAVRGGVELMKVGRQVCDGNVSCTCFQCLGHLEGLGSLQWWVAARGEAKEDSFQVGHMPGQCRQFVRELEHGLRVECVYMHVCGTQHVSQAVYQHTLSWAGGVDAAWCLTEEDGVHNDIWRELPSTPRFVQLNSD